MTNAIEPTEDELFKIYVDEGICDSVPFKNSLSRQPDRGYYAALGIWRRRNAAALTSPPTTEPTPARHEPPATEGA